VRNDPPERRIYCQARSAAGANQFYGRTLALAHYNLKPCSGARARGINGGTALSAEAQPARRSLHPRAPLFRYDVTRTQAMVRA